MSKVKLNIIAVLKGAPKGYIKSVSYSLKKFSLTQDKSQAKGYTTQDAIQKEIDFLTSVGYAYGYIFIYD